MSAGSMPDAKPGSQLPATALQPQPQGPIWVNVRENRLNTTKGSKKQSLYLQFYLVTADGKETLAAVGEDQGEAHYNYHSVPTFPQFGQLDCTNKRELMLWLEGICRLSQGKPAELTPPPQAVTAVAEHVVPQPSLSTGSGMLQRSSRPTSGSSLGSRQAGPEDSSPPQQFFSYRMERSGTSNARRRSTWYLTDMSGKEHAAVCGEERDTRDGHYNYFALPPFAHSYPLSCSNMGTVHAWLDARIAGLPADQPARVDGSQAAGALNAASTPALRKRTSSSKAGGPRGNKRSHGGALKAQEEEQWLANEARAEQHASACTVPAPAWPAIAAENTAVQVSAREAVAKRHQLEVEQKERWAKAQAEAAAKRAQLAGPPSQQVAALLWVRSELSSEESAVCDAWLGILRDAVAVLQPSPSAEATNPGQQRETEAQASAPQQRGPPMRQQQPGNADRDAAQAKGNSNGFGSALAGLLDYDSEEEQLSDEHVRASAASQAPAANGAHNPPAVPPSGRADSLVNGPQQQRTAAADSPDQQRRRVLALIDAQEAIRELGTMQCSLHLLIKLSPVFRGLHHHHEPSIAGMARGLLDRWRSITEAYLQILAAPQQGTAALAQPDTDPNQPATAQLPAAPHDSAAQPELPALSQSTAQPPVNPAEAASRPAPVEVSLQSPPAEPAAASQAGEARAGTDIAPAAPAAPHLASQQLPAAPRKADALPAKEPPSAQAALAVPLQNTSADAPPPSIPSGPVDAPTHAEAEPEMQPEHEDAVMPDADSLAAPKGNQPAEPQPEEPAWLTQHAAFPELTLEVNHQALGPSEAATAERAFTPPEQNVPAPEPDLPDLADERQPGMPPADSDLPAQPVSADAAAPVPLFSHADASGFAPDGQAGSSQHAEQAGAQEQQEPELSQHELDLLLQESFYQPQQPEHEQQFGAHQQQQQQATPQAEIQPYAPAEQAAYQPETEQQAAPEPDQAQAEVTASAEAYHAPAEAFAPPPIPEHLQVHQRSSTPLQQQQALPEGLTVRSWPHHELNTGHQPPEWPQIPAQQPEQQHQEADTPQLHQQQQLEPADGQQQEQQPTELQNPEPYFQQQTSQPEPVQQPEDTPGHLRHMQPQEMHPSVEQQQHMQAEQVHMSADHQQQISTPFPAAHLLPQSVEEPSAPVGQQQVPAFAPGGQQQQIAPQLHMQNPSLPMPAASFPPFMPQVPAFGMQQQQQPQQHDGSGFSMPMSPGGNLMPPAVASMPPPALFPFAPQVQAQLQGVAAQGAPPEGPAGIPPWIQAAMSHLAALFPGAPPAVALAMLSQMQQRTQMMLPPWASMPPVSMQQHPLLPPGGFMQPPFLPGGAPLSGLSQPATAPPSLPPFSQPGQQHFPGAVAAAAAQSEALHSQGSIRPAVSPPPAKRGRGAPRSSAGRRPQSVSIALPMPATSQQQQQQQQIQGEQTSQTPVSQQITIVPVVSASQAAGSSGSMAMRDAAGHLPVSISIGLPAAVAREIAPIGGLPSLVPKPVPAAISQATAAASEPAAAESAAAEAPFTDRAEDSPDRVPIAAKRKRSQRIKTPSRKLARTTEDGTVPVRQRSGRASSAPSSDEHQEPAGENQPGKRAEEEQSSAQLAADDSAAVKADSAPAPAQPQNESGQPGHDSAPRRHYSAPHKADSAPREDDSAASEDNSAAHEDDSARRSPSPPATRRQTRTSSLSKSTRKSPAPVSISTPKSPVSQAKEETRPASAGLAATRSSSRLAAASASASGGAAREAEPAEPAAPAHSMQRRKSARQAIHRGSPIAEAEEEQQLQSQRSESSAESERDPKESPAGEEFPQRESPEQRGEATARKQEADADAVDRRRESTPEQQQQRQQQTRALASPGQGVSVPIHSMTQTAAKEVSGDVVAEAADGAGAGDESDGEEAEEEAAAAPSMSTRSTRRTAAAQPSSPSKGRTRGGHASPRRSRRSKLTAARYSDELYPPKVAGASGGSRHRPRPRRSRSRKKPTASQSISPTSEEQEEEEEASGEDPEEAAESDQEAEAGAESEQEAVESEEEAAESEQEAAESEEEAGQAAAAEPAEVQQGDESAGAEAAEPAVEEAAGSKQEADDAAGEGGSQQELSEDVREALGALYAYARKQLRRLREAKQARVPATTADSCSKFLARIEEIGLPPEPYEKLTGLAKSMRLTGERLEQTDEQGEKGRQHRFAVNILKDLTDSIWEYAAESQTE